MNKKVLLGLASIAGILTWFPVTATVLIFIASGYDSGLVIALILLTIAAIGGFATLGVALYFLYHVNAEAKLSWEHKIIWSTVLIVFWILAAPVYWYYFIWKEGRGEHPSQVSDGKSGPDKANPLR